MKTIALTALVALGILFPVTFVPAQGNDSSQPEALSTPEPASEVSVAQADTIVIQIIADADSVIAVPSVVEVSPGEVVTWECELGEWMVFFRSAQPFGEIAVGQGIRGGQGQRNGQAVRNEAAEGSYKYDIMVRIQGGRNLRADPEIVVGPGAPK
ncbi:MAG: hypothetical protein HKO65_05600 [Gemmatimonadetes bacterium]|nr:hypothetical protein [Gemmatimonadota bacterium]NNM04559.1 hypothetical protein [Gemmatimonadota bacterium]